MQPVERLKELKRYADPIIERVFDTSQEMPEFTMEEMMCLNNYVEVLRQLGPDFITLWELLNNGKAATDPDVIDSHVCAVDLALARLNEHGAKIML